MHTSTMERRSQPRLGRQRRGGGGRRQIGSLATIVALAATLPILGVDAKRPRPGSVGPDSMHFIPGGNFLMGSTENDNESPVHEVYVNAFWIDETTVTNEQFAKFVEETGYTTIAEKPLDPKDFPELGEDELSPGAVVFSPPAPSDETLDQEIPHDNLDCCFESHVDRNDVTQWWKFVRGADWRHPEGPDSTLDSEPRGERWREHPVVDVAWDDAVAYCEWAGKRLPTEAEWERAARAGLEQKRFTWGSDELFPKGEDYWMTNIFQGVFPTHNIVLDGYAATAPVRSFDPNRWGLYEMSGNVWEWVADWYDPYYYRSSPRENPQGPSAPPTYYPDPSRVMRGGSFLCQDVYCKGYRPAGRQMSSPDTGLNNTGFRCVRTYVRGSEEEEEKKDEL